MRLEVEKSISELSAFRGVGSSGSGGGRGPVNAASHDIHTKTTGIATDRHGQAQIF